MAGTVAFTDPTIAIVSAVRERARRGAGLPGLLIEISPGGDANLINVLLLYRTYVLHKENLTDSRCKLAPDSFVPLYRQIAQNLRYRICTGAIGADTLLPPLREAAAAWGVNMHTVRRAYRLLEEQGLVTTRRPVGTRVVGDLKTTEPGGNPGALADFADAVLREARDRFGVGPGRVIEALEQANEHRALPPVWVVECSRPLAAELAQQIASTWEVDARPWSLDDVASIPEGVVVGSYFHYRELRAALAPRRSELGFVAIHPRL